MSTATLPPCTRVYDFSVYGLQPAAAPTAGTWRIQVGRHALDRRIVVDRADGSGTLDVAVMVPVPPEDEREARANELAMVHGPALLRELQHVLRFHDQLGPHDVLRMQALITLAGGEA